jgi:hypothetical protein
METFRQSVGNCFSCHDTRSYTVKYKMQDRDQEIEFPAMILNLSHALRRWSILNQQDLLQARHKVPPVPGK